jgi:hypothetical protein
MKAWIRNDRVYQTIMNGALLVVFLAALSTGKWPQLAWVSGSITVIMVLIAAAVYSIAACDNNKEKQAAAESVPQKETENVELKEQRRLMAARLLGERIAAEAFVAGAQQLRKQDLLLYSQWLEMMRPDTTRETADVILRNTLAHKSHARPVVRKRAVERINFSEDETGRLTVTVGPVRIEIQDEETNVHITSSKTTVVTAAPIPTDYMARDEKEPLTSPKTVH